MANEFQQSQTHRLCCDNKTLTHYTKYRWTSPVNCYTVFAWEFDFFNTIRPWLVVWLIHLNPELITCRNVQVAVAVDRHCQSTVTHGKSYTQQSILRLSCRQNTPFPQFMDWLRNTTKQNHHKYFWGDYFYILANIGVLIQLSICNYTCTLFLPLIFLVLHM